MKNTRFISIKVEVNVNVELTLCFFTALSTAQTELRDLRCKYNQEMTKK